MYHIGRSFMIAALLFFACALLLATPQGKHTLAQLQSSLLHLSAKLVSEQR